MSSQSVTAARKIAARQGPIAKKVQQIAGRRIGQAKMLANMIERGRLAIAAPDRYRKAIRDIIVEQGILHAQVATDLSQNTLLRIVAGYSIASGTLAKLILRFDGPEGWEEFLKEQAATKAERESEDVDDLAEFGEGDGQ